MNQSLTNRAASVAALLLLFALLAAGCGPKDSAGSGGGPASNGATGSGSRRTEAVTLRLAYFPNVTHAPAIVGVAEGAFQKAVGEGVTVEPRVFLNGPAAMEALLAEEVDIAYVGVSPAINAYIKSEGALKIVSGAASGGAVLVARRDSGITKMEDLIGKRIGTPQKGGTQDVAARYYITETLKQKLSEEGGATRIVPTDSPQIAQLFEQKQLDAAWLQEPWGARLVQEAGAALILDEREEWPNRRYATTVIVARTEFLNRHPDLVGKVLAAHVQTAEAIEKDKAQAAGTINGEIKRLTKRALAPEVIAESLGRIDFTYEPYPETLQTQADRAFALGFLGRRKPGLSGLLDLGPLNRALESANKPAVSADAQSASDAP